MAEEELGPKPLSKSRIKYADKMFDAYDENGSGTLDIEEFCQIMQRYDPDLDPASVETSFEMATNENPNMSREMFYTWLTMLFGDVENDDEFIAGCDEMLKAKKKALPPHVKPIKIDRMKRHVMDRKTAERSIIAGYERAARIETLMICRNCSSPATIYCFDCGRMSYCVDCSNLVHAMPQFASHQPGNINDINAETDIAPPVEIQDDAACRENMRKVNPWKHIPEPTLEEKYQLPEHRHAKAHELFVAYDADMSGYIDIDEFTELCTQFDPRLLPGEIAQSFKSVGVFDGKMDQAHFNMWLAMTFDGADDEMFNEGIQDLLAAVNPVSQAGEHMSRTLQDLATKLFKAYDTDASGFLDFSEFYYMLKKYDKNAPMDTVKQSFQNAGCTGELMSLKQFKAWVAIVFGKAPPGEAEEGLAQLLLASGLKPGDSEMRERIEMEKTMMGEHAKMSNLEKGERQIFRDPNQDKVRHGAPIPDAIEAPRTPKRSIKTKSLTKQERIKLEQSMMKEMQRKKDEEDGGVDAVKLLLEQEKAIGRGKQQDALKLLAETKAAQKKRQEVEQKLLQYMKDTEPTLKVMRWLVHTLHTDSQAQFTQGVDELVPLARRCYELGVLAGQTNPALAEVGMNPASGAKQPSASHTKNASRELNTRRMAERAIVDEISASARAQDPCSQILGAVCDHHLQQMERGTVLHKVQLGTAEEVMDWKEWSAVKDMSEMTPAAQAAVKHSRKQRQLSTVEEQQKKAAEDARNARPEYIAKAQLTQWCKNVAGVQPLQPFQAPTQTVAAKPPPMPSPKPTSPPTMKMGAVTPGLTMKMGAVSQNLSMSPSTSGLSMTPTPAPAPAIAPAPAAQSNISTAKTSPGAQLTPRQAERAVRHLGFTLTLREMEMAVRICKAASIPTDSDEFSIRLHELLYRTGTAGGAGGMSPMLTEPTKNTEPLRSYTRVKLSRACSGGQSGVDGDRKEWTHVMLEQAVAMLPEIESELTMLINQGQLA